MLGECGSYDRGWGVNHRQRAERNVKTIVSVAGPLVAAAEEAHETAHEGSDHGHSLAPEFQGDRPHHLSALIGQTEVDGEGSGFTVGADYEYRLNRRLGLGAVAEVAFGEVDAGTLLAVADIHLVKGLALQTGPGVEWLREEAHEGEDEAFESPDREAQFVYRVGLPYEFELGEEGFTLSPQLHYDLVPGSGEDAVVFALAFGRAF